MLLPAPTTPVSIVPEMYVGEAGEGEGEKEEGEEAGGVKAKRRRRREKRGWARGEGKTKPEVE